MDYYSEKFHDVVVNPAYKKLHKDIYDFVKYFHDRGVHYSDFMDFIDGNVKLIPKMYRAMTEKKTLGADNV